MKTRYVIAQAVILAHWALDWAMFGTSRDGSELQEGAVGALLVLLLG